jgi:hypothetical protein
MTLDTPIPLIEEDEVQPLMGAFVATFSLKKVPTSLLLGI